MAIFRKKPADPPSEQSVSSEHSLQSSKTVSGPDKAPAEKARNADVDAEQKITVQEHHPFVKFLLGGKIQPIPPQRTESRKGKANLFSQITWQWLTPYIRTGFDRTLEFNDMPLANDRDKNYHRMAVYRKKIEEYEKSGRTQYKEIFAAMHAMKFRFFLTFVVVCCYIAAELCVTLISRHLISEISLIYTHQKTNHGRAVGLAIGNTLISITFQVFLVWFGYKTRYFAELTRTMAISAIFDKVTRLSPRGRQQFPPSKITSIITTDTNRLFMAARWTPMLFSFLPAFGAMLGLLYSYIGISALPGIGLVVLGICLNVILSRLITRLRRKSIPFADRRIAAIRETVENMRIIKFYGWELSFVDLISKARWTEAHFLKLLGLVEGITDAMTTSMPFFAGLLAFAVRIIIGKNLEPALAFPSLSVFQLFVPLTMFFSAGINTHADALASLRRLNEFFNADEETTYIQTTPADSPSSIVIKGGHFKWDVEPITPQEKKKERRFLRFLNASAKRQENNPNADLLPGRQSLENDEADFIAEKNEGETARDLSRAGAKKFPGLVNINLDIKRNELIMIVGTIGSGKTSLLSSFVGNITKLDGSVEVAGRVSSVLSTWSQNATIRDNILFGQDYDAERYAEVVRVCSLESDFAQFPSRDFVEVGERGITLSGGQKARISLARCVYHGGDTILLDDVLSAVDGKVAAYIFNECILGYLRNTTRVISTHNLKLLSQADRVIFMDGFGGISVGTLPELLQSNESFKSMYVSGLNVNEQDDLEKSTEAAENEKKDDESDENYENDEEDVKEISKVATAEGVVAKRQLSRAPEHADAKLMIAEQRARGQVKGNIVFEYMNSGNRIGFWFIFIIFFFAAWVATASTMQTVFLNFWSSDRYHKSNGFYIGMYAVVMFSRFLGYVCLTISIASFCFTAASVVHNKAVENLYRAPISYFDSTPLGRLINRFTDDTANLDTQLYMLVRMFLFSCSMLTGSLIVIFVYVPYTIIAIVPVLIIAAIFMTYYRAGSRELKRINSLFRSKMFSVVMETVSGLPVILAYKRGVEYREILNERIDDLNATFSLATASQYWMALRVVLAATIIVFLTIMLAVFQVFSLDAASVGMLLSLLPSVSISLGMILPIFAELENQVNSVERLYELAHDIPQEAAYHIETAKPAENWPETGSISFVDASLRYRPELPDVLKNLSLDIKPGEKVGIVGRTGAGKSTIMSALFRLNELSGGKIVIDGVDIATIGLEDLRQKLAIIPQEPVLFQGTIRFNVDPFGQHTDAELWDSLRRSGVIRENEIVNGQVNSEHKFHLDTKIDSDGTNLSLGERQLLTLARALVRQSKIIALDEATASVDFETDRMIQETIAREFKGATILSIAHRLQTIIGYDRVVVMDKGEIREHGNPHALFKDATSVFHSMALDSGLSEDDFVAALK